MRRLSPSRAVQNNFLLRISIVRLQLYGSPQKNSRLISEDALAVFVTNPISLHLNSRDVLGTELFYYPASLPESKDTTTLLCNTLHPATYRTWLDTTALTVDLGINKKASISILGRYYRLTLPRPLNLQRWIIPSNRAL